MKKNNALRTVAVFDTKKTFSTVENVLKNTIKDTSQSEKVDGTMIDLHGVNGIQLLSSQFLCQGFVISVFKL
jgi:hypothetical protein